MDSPTPDADGLHHHYPRAGVFEPGQLDERLGASYVDYPRSLIWVREFQLMVLFHGKLIE